MSGLYSLLKISAHNIKGTEDALLIFKEVIYFLL